MTRTQSRLQQSAFRKFAKIDHWKSPHAVTLTIKQGIPVANGYMPTMAFIDNAKASQNLGHFHSILSRKILGKPADRFHQRLNMIPVIEGGNGKRFHYHVMLDCPRHDLDPAFPDIICNAWSKTQWGHRQIDIQPGANEGWIDYISKLRDKANWSDSIDWSNYHNPD
jgi:hypothetical protein